MILKPFNKFNGLVRVFKKLLLILQQKIMFRFGATIIL